MLTRSSVGSKKKAGSEKHELFWLTIPPTKSHSAALFRTENSLLYTARTPIPDGVSPYRARRSLCSVEVLTDIPSPGFSSNRLLAFSDPRHSWGTTPCPHQGLCFLSLCQCHPLLLGTDRWVIFLLLDEDVDAQGPGLTIEQVTELDKVFWGASNPNFLVFPRGWSTSPQPQKAWSKYN